MAATLLTVMLLMPYISEGVLLRKSTAMDFLQKIREKRASECFPGGCSTEASEAAEMIESVELEESHSLIYNGGAAQTDVNISPDSDAMVGEGSGM